MKKCSKCGEEKPLTEFEANKQHSTGYGARCKECATAIHKKYRPPAKTQRGGITKKESARQQQIAKYGIAVVEAMEALDDC